MSGNSTPFHSRCIAEVAYTVRWSASAFVASLLIIGCSTSATIRLNNGEMVRGRIERGDHKVLYLSLDQHAGDVQVARSDIVEVRHPGRAAGITGAVLVGLSAVTFVALVAKLTNCPTDTDCWVNVGAGSLVFITMSAVGIPLGIWGLVVNRQSRARAEPPVGWAQLHLAPVVFPEGDRVCFGGAVRLSW